MGFSMKTRGRETRRMNTTVQKRKGRYSQKDGKRDVKVKRGGCGWLGME